jgi:hypothetical protein
MMSLSPFVSRRWRRGDLATIISWWPGVLEGGEALPSAAACADLPGEDESFTPLTDVELVQLVLSDNAPGLVDVLDTDKQIIPEIGLSSCLTALELTQVTLSANGAFSAETGRQACRRD